MSTLTVDANGTELAYIDSGAPATSTHDYVTIFAIHGMMFGYHIYDKVFALAQGADVRLVAINRRGYPGSTALSAEDMAALAGTDEQKEAFIQARGLEVATFIDKFIEVNDIPPISEDGTAGGIALMGWSLGCCVSLSVVSHIRSYPQSVQKRLGAYLRAHILHEPPQVALGHSISPKTWLPNMNPNLTPEKGALLTAHYLSAYFRHGDLSKRSPDALEYVVPATFRPPTVFSMSDAHMEKIFNLEAGGPDTVWYLGSGPQLFASYRKACFDKAVRAKVPKMKTWVLVGEATFTLCLGAAWRIEEEDAVAGGGFVKTRWFPDINHFIQWDEPELAMKSFVEMSQ
ncbi:Alpha/Beta hydrolase protein [Daedaleopsis nitida]|nr:Alpha/Beta hydrolase protein [Daedaleopsis nitida]